jgi:glycosyltransferase involved in cell wall biosynthesis
VIVRIRSDGCGVASVAFFSNQFADVRGHGLARYARELFAALRAREDVAVTPVAGWSSLSHRPLADLRRETGLKLTGLGRRLTPLAWTYLGGPALERLIGQPIDVVHAVALGYPVATRKKLVVTVHDLGPLTHPEYFRNTRPWVMERSLRQAERQADVIICVSRSTADEVCTYLGDGVADRVRVVHEGVSREFFAPADGTCLNGLSLPAEGIPYILSVGKISPRKNVQGVIRALHYVMNEIPHHLVLVGGSGWDTEVATKEVTSPALRERLHFLGYVDDEQLRALYQRAAVYVHPSLYEGFGLTVLEAMASGAPVIASNASALPEVAGDTGRLVDPADSEALSHELREICSNAGLAGDLARRGRAHAATFRWADCAASVAEIYREASGGRHP